MTTLRFLSTAQAISEEQADELYEQQAAIAEQRDVAWQYGYDEYGVRGLTADAGAQRFDHPTLQQDYRNGWAAANRDAATSDDCATTAWGEPV